jgi:hypothetical protein
MLAVARVALSNAFPQGVPDGIGTGVTIAIAPPGGIPSGCAAAWNGSPFGIAAVNIASNRRADVDTDATPTGGAYDAYGAYDGYDASDATAAFMSPTVAASRSRADSRSKATSKSGGYKGTAAATSAASLSAAYSAAYAAFSGAPSPAAGEDSFDEASLSAAFAALSAAPEAMPRPAHPGMAMDDMDALDMEAFPSSPKGAADSFPEHMKFVKEVVRAGADSEPDTTITVRSTRTHTRTVTVKSNTPAPKATAQPLSPVDLSGKPSIKVGIIYQIEDGQVQAPIKQTPVQVSHAAPAPGPGATGKPHTPSAPMTAGSSPSPHGAGGYPSGGYGGSSPSSGSPPLGSYPSYGSGKPPGSPTQPSLATPPSRTTQKPRISEISDGQIQAPVQKRQAPGADVLIGCKTNSILTLTLTNGVLKDNKGRTGYIASNRQLQYVIHL